MRIVIHTLSSLTNKCPAQSRPPKALDFIIHIFEKAIVGKFLKSGISLTKLSIRELNMLTRAARRIVNDGNTSLGDNCEQEIGAYPRA